jgi:hypothetical protein
VRSAAFVALLARMNEAKAEQAAYMVEHHLVFDVLSKETRVMIGSVPTQYTATDDFTRLLAASKAAQANIKAYKLSHRAEFRPQNEGRIPVIRRPVPENQAAAGSVAPNPKRRRSGMGK